MDALQFATDNLEEVKARLADNEVTGILTPQEVVQKFFDDQGLQFTDINVDEILALANNEGKGVE